MSIAVTADSKLASPGAADVAAPTRNLPLWPAVVVLAIFWAFLYANHNVEMSMFARFISRLAAYGLLLLCFFGWWLTRSAVNWRERVLAIVVAVVCFVGTWTIADKSIDAFGLFLSAFPSVATAWVLWLIVARTVTPSAQRIGFCAVMLVTFGYFALLRFDGIDGAQRPEMSWRWQPTKEQEFLVGRGGAAPTVSSATPWTLRPGDCPEYRGRNRDGVIHGMRVVADWNEHPPKMIWKHRVGPAWSGMIVVDDHLVTQEQRGDVESVTCYDAKTGQEIWAHDDAVRFEESLSGAGPRGTPTFVDSRIYSLGGKGTLNCLAAETGAVIWSHDIVADAKLEPKELPQWGYSASPLVVDGLVIVYAGGKQGKSVLAYHAGDGTLAWTTAAGSQSYSSPQLVELAGAKQVLMQDNRGLTAIAPADGKLLWEVPSASERSLPMLQPHETESDEILWPTEPGLTLLELKKDGDKWSSAPRWTTNKFRPNFNDFVIHAGYVYGLDNGILCCFDLKTGERLWKKGRFGFGQLLMLADQDAILLSTDKGELVLASVTPEGHEELGRFQVIEGKTWNSPVLVGNRVYLRNGEEMAAYELHVESATTAAGDEPANSFAL